MAEVTIENRESVLLQSQYFSKVTTTRMSEGGVPKPLWACQSFRNAWSGPSHCASPPKLHSVNVPPIKGCQAHL